jgi:hypothetical protein
MRPHGSYGSWPGHKIVRFNESQCQVLLGTYLLFDLQRINGRGKLAEDLIRLLVELKLSSDQISQVAQRLGGIKNLT